MNHIPIHCVAEVDDPLSIQPFADGVIGGDFVRFLIDTGAVTCLVPSTQATRAIPSLGRSSARGLSNISAEDDTVIIPEIRIGGLVAVDVEADRAELDVGRHPLLGMNVLGKHRCLFRLASGSIDLDAEPPANATVGVLETRFAVPFVSVDFGHHATRACWDTGASRSAVDQAWAQRHPELVTIDQVLAGRDSQGAHVEARAGTLAACSIGGVSFAASPCVIVDFAPLNGELDVPIEVCIGAPLIVRADWWFDFPGGQWAVVGR